MTTRFPHFSFKVLTLSVLVLLITLGLPLLKALNTSDELMMQRSAQLLLEDGQTAEIKSPYQSALVKVTENQTLASGAEIQTVEGQEAELRIAQNRFHIGPNTHVKLLENNLPVSDLETEAIYITLELLEGELWAEAFDPVQVNLSRAEVYLLQTGAQIQTASGQNHVAVFEGDLRLDLLDEEENPLNYYVLSLGNQVNFVDTQLTQTYATLKPSKLEKELKRRSLSTEDWVNWGNHVTLNSQALKSSGFALVNSTLAYQLKKTTNQLWSWLGFSPQAKEKAQQHQLENKLGYVLGHLSETGDRVEAKKILTELNPVVSDQLKHPEVRNLLIEAFYSTQNAEFGSPAYLARDFLLETLKSSEGPFLFRVYLMDVQTFLSNKDLDLADVTLKKWSEQWPEAAIETNVDEYHRQSHLLYHTLLRYPSVLSVAILDHFDQTGAQRLAYNQDMEETRFEIAQERLQLTAQLIEAQRYLLAKQYLKNSYLTLRIEENDPSLPSTQIFLETGQLLAERLDYADKVLKNAAKPIEEEAFLAYLQSRARDRALTANLRNFFAAAETDSQAETEILSQVQGSAEEVLSQFEDAGLTLTLADISPQDTEGYMYQIAQASLQESSEGGPLTFSARYDLTTGAVSEVALGEQTYAGPFLLVDLVTLLKSDGFESNPDTAQILGDVDSLLSGQQEADSLRDQALAQDVAIKLALTKLSEAGILVQNLKTDVQVLDAVNLDKFKISKASIKTLSDKQTFSFNFFSTLDKATDIRNAEGRLLLKESPLSQLADWVSQRFGELEEEAKLIKTFKDYARQNSLIIEDDNIVYTAQNLLLLTDLTLDRFDLKATGLYDMESQRFLSAKNGLLSLENVTIREFFEQLLEATLIERFKAIDIDILAYQIESIYPFKSIKLKNVVIGESKFDFTLLYQEFRPTNIRDLTLNKTLENMSFEMLKSI